MKNVKIRPIHVVIILLFVLLCGVMLWSFSKYGLGVHSNTDIEEMLATGKIPDSMLYRILRAVTWK